MPATSHACSRGAFRAGEHRERQQGKLRASASKASYSSSMFSANSAISVSCTWCRPGSGASRESLRTVLVLGVGLWALSSEREASKISCLVPERPGRPEMTSKFRTKMTRQQLLQFSPHSCSTTLDDACLQHPLTGQLQSLSTLACDRANMAMVLSDGLVDCSWLTLCSIQSWPAECYAWSYFLLPGGRTTS